MSHSRTIHQSHLGWDNSLEPAARIAPGESLQFDVLDAAGGQLSSASSVEDAPVDPELVSVAVPVTSQSPPLPEKVPEGKVPDAVSVAVLALAVNVIFPLIDCELEPQVTLKE